MKILLSFVLKHVYIVAILSNDEMCSSICFLFDNNMRHASYFLPFSPQDDSCNILRSNNPSIAPCSIEGVRNIVKYKLSIPYSSFKLQEMMTNEANITKISTPPHTVNPIALNILIHL